MYVRLHEYTTSMIPLLLGTSHIIGNVKYKFELFPDDVCLLFEYVWDVCGVEYPADGSLLVFYPVYDPVVFQ